MFSRLTRAVYAMPSARFLSPAALSLLLLLSSCQSPEPTPTPAPVAGATAETQATTPAATPQAVAQEAATSEVTAEATTAPVSLPERSAYVRGGILYIQNGPTEADVVPVEDCSANDCMILYLDWSPSGNLLAYHVGGYNNTDIPARIRIAAVDGTAQTVTDQAAYVQPAAWSWDGAAIVYRTDTGRYAEATEGPARRIHELWSVAVAEDGALGAAVAHGETTFGEGCGGGGRSESANVYEREGGFAYGYLSGIIAWTPGDILLYSDNCTTRGVNRYDLANNVALEPYTGDLRSLSLNAAGDAWVAINSENQIVTGTPAGIETTDISSTAAPEIVFYGQKTGTIYYTVLEMTGGVDLIDQANALFEQEIMIFPYFDTTMPRLIALDPATGAERELYAGDGYAYARVTELEGGSVIFSRVEDNSELMAAVQNEELTGENWRLYLPTVDVLMLAPGSSEPTALLVNAAQYTVAN